jgi:hypothetical protein
MAMGFALARYGAQSLLSLSLFACVALIGSLSSWSSEHTLIEGLVRPEFEEKSALYVEHKSGCCFCFNSLGTLKTFVATSISVHAHKKSGPKTAFAENLAKQGSLFRAALHHGVSRQALQHR